MESIGLKIYNNRILVSKLIFSVLTNEMTVLEAISKFPDDKTDINIKCAFDALMHREADEDLRKTVKGYKELQDDLLETIANILKENNKLPQNIISSYCKYHNQDIIYKKPKNFINDVLLNLKRKINI